MTNQCFNLNDGVYVIGEQVSGKVVSIYSPSTEIPEYTYRVSALQPGVWPNNNSKIFREHELKDLVDYFLEEELLGAKSFA